MPCRKFVMASGLGPRFPKYPGPTTIPEAQKMVCTRPKIIDLVIKNTPTKESAEPNGLPNEFHISRTNTSAPQTFPKTGEGRNNSCALT